MLLLVPLPPPELVLDEPLVDVAPLVSLVPLVVLELLAPELALEPPDPLVAFEPPDEAAPPQLNTAALLAKIAGLVA